jgi:hypothetical protein
LFEYWKELTGEESDMLDKFKHRLLSYDECSEMWDDEEWISITRNAKDVYEILR